MIKRSSYRVGDANSKSAWSSPGFFSIWLCKDMTQITVQGQTLALGKQKPPKRLWKHRSSPSSRPTTTWSTLLSQPQSNSCILHLVCRSQSLLPVSQCLIKIPRDAPNMCHPSAESCALQLFQHSLAAPRMLASGHMFAQPFSTRDLPLMSVSKPDFTPSMYP
jgi:hypothetical protein